MFLSSNHTQLAFFNQSLLYPNHRTSISSLFTYSIFIYQLIDTVKQKQRVTFILCCLHKKNVFIKELALEMTKNTEKYNSPATGILIFIQIFLFLAANQ